MKRKCSQVFLSCESSVTKVKENLVPLFLFLSNIIEPYLFPLSTIPYTGTQSDDTSMLNLTQEL